MPGVFCALGGNSALRRALEREFSAVWPDLEVSRSGDAVLGGHAFASLKAVRTMRKGYLLGLDGELSFYREEAFAEELEDPSHWTDGVLDPQVASIGVAVLVDPERHTVHAAVDASGTLPLYYAIHDGGLLLSSLCRPVGRALGQKRDDLAALEFLRNAYFVGPKTIFAGVRRLLPGQALRYELGVGLRLIERSRAWVDTATITKEEAAEEAWTRLGRAMERGLTLSDSALMMSGGWDSRTLLGRANSSDRELFCYSHGDRKSRELRIVRKLCGAADQPYQLEPIDDRILDPDRLVQGFERMESVSFPHWLRAGELLGERGITCVTAGVFGEILGGHYGPSMLAGSRGKILSVAASILGLEPTDDGRCTASEHLATPDFGHHWYLDPAFEASIEEPRQQLDAAVDEAIQRLRARGVRDQVALVEAFVSEHRGAQYINTQLRSCRAFTDISVPFAGGEVFTFSTRVPLKAKIHNTVNRRMLARHAPYLLRQPMAATLVPAGAPLLLQEGSRLVRGVYQSGRLALNGISGGRVSPAHLGWMNFDFLRNSQALHVLVDDLRSDIWDREGIRKRINGLPQEEAQMVHPLFDQFAKIYTVDLLLR